MKLTKIFCDKCKREISGVVYHLTCYADDVEPMPLGGVSLEAGTQNIKQNASTSREADLCKACKDKITDGIFIV